MAINIFSGSSSSRNNKPKANVASNSVRAQQARNALAAPAETSSSGNTAVGTKGTLQKVGNVVGKVAGIASKFLPGLGGTIAGAVSNLLNDPEWWQSTPGDALTLNEPLRYVEFGERDGVPTGMMRLAIGEVVVRGYSTSGLTLSSGPVNVATYCIDPTEQMITQYLMPQIRKVVNAVPLQDASDYSVALRSGATIYALWRQLRKVDYMCKHGQTYLASMNDPAFPLFQTANASWLQATINRLEEYLRANVRLPHTMCEYLAWRYGRVYKSNNSVKAGLVLYDVMPLAAPPAHWDKVINLLMDAITSAPTAQKANTDLYNTYYDHDMAVDVRDDTQFTFDMKEFMLRLNLQGVPETPNDLGFTTLVAIDSSLDNPTAFMASTVSTLGTTRSGAVNALFPVDSRLTFYAPKPWKPTSASTANGAQIFQRTSPSASTWVYECTLLASAIVATGNSYGPGADNATGWASTTVQMDRYYLNELGSNTTAIADALKALVISKSMDFYNLGVYLTIWAGVPASTTGFSDAERQYWDLTALSIDAGSPTRTTLDTEHVYAFANLVDIERKHSMSYKQAERLVARDTADLVDKLDISTASTSTKSA